MQSGNRKVSPFFLGFRVQECKAGIGRSRLFFLKGLEFKDAKGDSVGLGFFMVCMIPLLVSSCTFDAFLARGFPRLLYCGG
jgi:hypothetical protein